MPLSPQQARLLADIKLASASGAPEVPVISREGRRIGGLLPLTRERAASPRVLEDLYRWRKASMSTFLTVFSPTVAKTKAYIEKLYLPDPARLLFVIRDAGGTPIGNIGLCNVTEEDAEIDNVIRGEAVREAGFMQCVQRALLSWAFDALGVERVYLNVLSDNARAIRSYERSGFSPVGRTALVRKDTEEGYVLVPRQDETVRDGDRHLLRMEISREAFSRQVHVEARPVQGGKNLGIA